jgi:prolyl oligopeptidase
MISLLIRTCTVCVLLSATSLALPSEQADDPFAWLEEIDGDRALTWVKAQNQRSLAILEGDARYAELFAHARALVDATDRIPAPRFAGGSVHNFWQDQTNVRGLLRRTSLSAYCEPTPEWETLLDIDELSRREKANWVYHGSVGCWPDERRFLVELSDGGRDAVQLREFDAESKSFPANGFLLPNGKQYADWENPDTLLVSREWESGQLTPSGYPYIIKRLRRGQSLAEAEEVFRGEAHELMTTPYALHDGDDHTVVIFNRQISFYEAQLWIDAPGGPVKLAVPGKHRLLGMVSHQLIVSLQEDWQSNATTYRSGALLAIDVPSALTSPLSLQAKEIMTPGPRQSIDDVTVSKTHVLLSLYDNVRGCVLRYSLVDGAWTPEKLALPENSSVHVAAAETTSDDIILGSSGFLEPSKLWLLRPGEERPRQIKSLPARFDASGLIVEQNEATSRDGTKVPYFLVHKKDDVLAGARPTLLSGYGGFEISLTPYYSPMLGKLWLEYGGAYAIANIRGGGEFGPGWHQAALKQNRQRAFDDFAAVAEDLIKRKLTSPRRLGASGGSNGGLLMGVQMTQRPELWNALAIKVPLLDMLRYDRMSAGSLWLDEYGNPAVAEERAFLQTISPYHHLASGTSYPEPFFMTSTKDDRVHPGHARKMAAKMESLGLPFLFYENTDGGHAAAANLQETARRHSLEYVYLMRKLMD